MVLKFHKYVQEERLCIKRKGNLDFVTSYKKSSFSSVYTLKIVHFIICIPELVSGILPFIKRQKAFLRDYKYVFLRRNLFRFYPLQLTIPDMVADYILPNILNIKKRKRGHNENDICMP